jgi:uncharacterized Zn finger protein
MQITDDTIRDLCTPAIYERGETYLSDSRIQQLSRFNDTVTATVKGSRDYDVHLDFAADQVAPQCSCPYDGSGVCKHVVAVLLRLKNNSPEDMAPRMEAVLGDADADELRGFLREELQSNPALADRFFAWFGEPAAQSMTEIRADIDRLFDETNPEYPVVFEPIDFSEFFTLAERYREQGEFQSAAAVYRALVEGLDDNMEHVDGAYDHFANAFQTALDTYVDCLANAELTTEELTTSVEFLQSRAVSGTPHLRDRFQTAANELEEQLDAEHR